jgi:chromosome segregation ATPase
MNNYMLFENFGNTNNTNILQEKNNKIVELIAKTSDLTSEINNKDDQIDELKKTIDLEKQNTKVYIDKYNKLKTDINYNTDELERYKNKIKILESKYNNCIVSHFETDNELNKDKIIKKEIINNENKDVLLEGWEGVPTNNYFSLLQSPYCMIFIILIVISYIYYKKNK